MYLHTATATHTHKANTAKQKLWCLCVCNLYLYHTSKSSTDTVNNQKYPPTPTLFCHETAKKIECLHFFSCRFKKKALWSLIIPQKEGLTEAKGERNKKYKKKKEKKKKKTGEKRKNRKTGTEVTEWSRINNIPQSNIFITKNAI